MTVKYHLNIPDTHMRFGIVAAIRRLASTCAVALLFAGCGGDTPAEPQKPVDPRSAVAGTYALRSVNSAPLPYVYETDLYGISKYTGGTMLIRADGTFRETVDIRIDFNGSAAPTIRSDVYQGTYSLTGSQITFTIPATQTNQAFSWSGAAAGGVVTYTLVGESFRYER